ncbi:cytochrome c oxidase subunit II [Novimethylophilus kurashikiensis]|uniref:Cytochrome c oxidase subunit 2 n=1 Tax=Novimethylophilus kurashikiensis TaxID=1825523 RepID=A0A2R5F3T6_9PROT|nr:cytochrome c oxidase subunit II [Novimethylophilus kurashikiensis]GBG12729.1 cytochrome c oxidase subunit II [Novimethylophilus kurashikiensis]
MFGKKLWRQLVCALPFLLAAPLHAEYRLNLQTPASPVAQQIYDLHNLILLVCFVIFIIVFGVMFVALVKHRKSVGHQAVQFHENTKLEIVWTIIPFIILVGMAYPTTKTIFDMRNTGHPDMTIKVTGHQWIWEYEYMGEGVRFLSNLSTPQDQIDNKVEKDPHYLLEVDNPMVVPTGKKVRVLLTATDVIHSWWVPTFGVKQDAIPGFIHEAWFTVDNPGTYRGQCAELCGVRHGYMPVVVEAVDPASYTAWLTRQKATMAEAAAASAKTYTLAELKSHGEKVFTTSCAMCHQATGQGVPGTFPPLVEGAPFAAAKGMTDPIETRGFWKDGKIVLGPKEKHLDIVMHGITGTAMPAFAGQLSDFDIAAVITFERNNWGNHTGDMIQPSEVATLRKSTGKSS